MDLKDYFFKPTVKPVDFHDISLESFGITQLWGEIGAESSYEMVDFIVKSNIINSELPELKIILNSVGGETSEGFAIIDAIESSKLPISILGTGNIMSMGILIIASGTRGKRIMTKNACVMAHQFSGIIGGKFHELEATRDSMLYLKKQFEAHFLKHTNMTNKQIADVLLGPSDRYLSPTECKEFGIIDEIVDEIPELTYGKPKRKKSA